MGDRAREVERIARAIHGNERFVLTTHVKPDGDGLGSEMALWHALTSLHKDALIVNASPVPRLYAFLDPEGERIRVHSDREDAAILDADVILILDISDTHRLGSVGPVVDRSRALRICIDHHASPELETELSLLDPGASATGELIFEVLRQAEVPLTPEIAGALYTAILADTGCFRYSNTSAKAHAIAAELLRAGVDHQDISGHIYESNSWGKTLLFARAVGSLRSECDGRIAWMRIPQSLFAETGAEPADTEGLVEFPRNTRRVSVSVLFVEQPDGTIKVSFRSKPDTSVDDLAARFGGGGHRNAAAAVVSGSTLDETIGRVLEAASRHVRSCSTG